MTPCVSGLGNERAMRAACACGVRYLVSDTSVPGQASPTPNTGIRNALVSAILEVPRVPTNICFDASTPLEETSELRAFLASGVLSAYPVTAPAYADIVDFESATLLRSMLRFDANPFMFHQPNARAYDGRRSLLSDLFDATAAKYDALMRVPVRCLPLAAIGSLMEDRMQRNAALPEAILVPGVSIQLRARGAALVPITGLEAPGWAERVEEYGGEPISWFRVAAGSAITIPLGRGP